MFESQKNQLRQPIIPIVTGKVRSEIVNERGRCPFASFFHAYLDYWTRSGNEEVHAFIQLRYDHSAIRFSKTALLAIGCLRCFSL